MIRGWQQRCLSDGLPAHQDDALRAAAWPPGLPTDPTAPSPATVTDVPAWTRALNAARCPVRNTSDRVSRDSSSTGLTDARVVVVRPERDAPSPAEQFGDGLWIKVRMVGDGRVELGDQVGVDPGGDHGQSTGAGDA